MAEIQSTVLSFDANSPSTMFVDLTLLFTAREVAEDYLYGVNVAVIRDRPDQVIITTHKGYRAMQYVALPLSYNNSDLQVGYAALTITPAGSATKTLQVQVDAYGTVASGERLKALVTVVPEIAETVNFSGPQAFP